MRDAREAFVAALAVTSLIVHTSSNVSGADTAAQDDSLCRPRQARSYLSAFTVMCHTLA